MTSHFDGGDNAGAATTAVAPRWATTTSFRGRALARVEVARTSRIETPRGRTALRPDAILFDLDGTLLDTEAVYRDAFMQAAACLGLAIPEEVYAGLVGIATSERGMRLRRLYGESFPWERLREAYYRRRCALLGNGPRLKPGAADLLGAVDRLGLGKAIVTAASRRTTVRHLAATGLARRFDLVVTRDDVIFGKPAPDGFRRAARGLGALPERCLAIEDSAPGIAAALAAGVAPILVREPSLPEARIAARCLCVVRDLGEIAAMLPT